MRPWGLRSALPCCANILYLMVTLAIYISMKTKLTFAPRFCSFVLNPQLLNTSCSYASIIIPGWTHSYGTYVVNTLVMHFFIPVPLVSYLGQMYQTPLSVWLEDFWFDSWKSMFWLRCEQPSKNYFSNKWTPICFLATVILDKLF